MTGYYFDESGVRRIVAAVRRVENESRNTPLNLPPMVASGTSETYIECKNNASETIPAYSVVSLTAGTTLDGRKIPYAVKPSTTFYPLHGFTCSLDSASTSKVGVIHETGLVKYDTGTPATGEGWGIKPGQYTLSKGYPGARCIEVVDSTNKIMRAEFLPITVLLGQTTNAVSANTPTTDYIILAGTAGSESDAGFTTVPSAVCAIALDTATKVELFFINNQWQMVPAVNGTPGSTRLVKTTTSHAANATATVNVWVGTPGSEVVSTGPVTLSATNKSTSAIPSGTFCLATLTNVADAGDPEDLQWYLIPLNSSAAYIYHTTCPSPGVAAGASINITLPSFGSTSCVNWSAVNLSSTDKITAYRDTDDGLWYLIKSGGTSTFRLIEGTVYSAFTKDTATFDIFVTRDYSGTSLPGDRVTVQNYEDPGNSPKPYLFEGETGACCSVIYDASTGLLRVNWVECPESPVNVSPGETGGSMSDLYSYGGMDQDSIESNYIY